MSPSFAYCDTYRRQPTYGSCIIQCVSFVDSRNTVVLSIKKPVSAGTFLDSCGAQDSDKRDTVYKCYIYVLFSAMCEC
jgi:hypothetical protein